MQKASVPFDTKAFTLAFNEAVTTGDWSSYLAAFHHDAVLHFVGVPVGPFVGLDAIAQAYAAQPPDDEIEWRSPPVEHGDHVVLRCRWVRTGAPVMMHLAVRDGQVAGLTVEFESPA